MLHRGTKVRAKDGASGRPHDCHAHLPREIINLIVISCHPIIIVPSILRCNIPSLIRNHRRNGPCTIRYPVAV